MGRIPDADTEGKHRSDDFDEMYGDRDEGESERPERTGSLTDPEMPNLMRKLDARTGDGGDEPARDDDAEDAAHGV